MEPRYRARHYTVCERRHRPIPSRAPAMSRRARGTVMLPRLATERLVLRQRSEDDLQAILQMDTDPEVMRFLDGPRLDLSEHEKEVRARIHKDLGPGLGYWSVFPHAQPDAFLGYM